MYLHPIPKKTPPVKLLDSTPVQNIKTTGVKVFMFGNWEANIAIKA